MTPLDILSGTFSVINGAIVFGQFVLKLSDVDGDTRTCIALLERVNRDLDEAETLRKLKYSAKGPKCRQHLRALEAIRDTRNAAFEVGKLVCVPKSGSLGFKNRLQWVMSDKESFVTREKTLHYSHVALLQVITTMESRSTITSLNDSPDSPQPPYHEVTVDHPLIPTPKAISIPSGERFHLPNGPLALQGGHSRTPEWETPSQKYIKRTIYPD
ncbi:hypothetical protein BGZ60DRAFT_437991 [Tricladium varicosporioides]|nr:hypothetical protein BGZ60DRAFT_437991 [Hymenoscyphus varicosporioides]